MVNRESKKGAVEMSLNLIIMLVIGLTVMGLVIGFVTSFLGDIKNEVTIGEDDKDKIEQVKKLDENFAFLSTTMTLTKGNDDGGRLYFKIRNPTIQDDLNIFNGGEVIPSATDFGIEVTGAGATYSTGDIIVYSPPIELDSGESAGYPLQLNIGDNIETGTYFIKFTITVDTETYSEVITLNIN